MSVTLGKQQDMGEIWSPGQHSIARLSVAEGSFVEDYDINDSISLSLSLP